MQEYSGKSGRVIVIGASAGGVNAARSILNGLPSELNGTILFVLHRMKNVDSRLDHIFQKFTSIKVMEVEDKQAIRPNHIYVAPSNYHVHLEEDGYFSLSTDELENFSRPSIDVSMESAAEFAEKNCLGIVLTGANSDGTLGLKKILEKGGLGIIQDPEDAEVSRMPEAAIEQNNNAAIFPLPLIIEFIKEYDANNIPLSP